jgi:hypothetical protein
MALFGNQRKGSQSSILSAFLSSIPSSPPTDDGAEYNLGIDDMVFSSASTHNISKNFVFEIEGDINGNSRRSLCQSRLELSPCSQEGGARHDLSGQRKHLSIKSELHVTLEHIPDLILDLESAVETSAKRPSKALRTLFFLSQQSGGPTETNPNRNRIEMVHRFNCTDQNNRRDEFYSNIHTGALVPALLRFLKRCKHNSNEQYLSLLVLNNISIPLENKRVRELWPTNGYFGDVVSLPLDSHLLVPRCHEP